MANIIIEGYNTTLKLPTRGYASEQIFSLFVRIVHKADDLYIEMKTNDKPFIITTKQAEF